jgi:hypothetical protein
MAMRLVRPALRLLPEQVVCMAASYFSRVTWRFTPPRVSAVMPEPCVWTYTLVGAGLVVRGGDFSCEAKTCCARRRLVV